MDQIVYIAIIAAAMVFGWCLARKRQAERQEQARGGDAAEVAARKRKPRPRKKR